MKMGLDPTTAAQRAMEEIVKYYPKFNGSIVTANMKGQYGSACANWDFAFSVVNPTLRKVHVQPVVCTKQQ
jgi:N4-(beta-N-acetylglucosaminyl)-L-asparaginase